MTTRVSTEYWQLYHSLMQRRGVNPDAPRRGALALDRDRRLDGATAAKPMRLLCGIGRSLSEEAASTFST
jgi:hypothetical protein